MNYVLVISYGGVNEIVSVHEDQDDILERLNRWLPELRAGRVQLQDFGYKRAVVSENGNRVYEIFEVANRPMLRNYDLDDNEVWDMVFEKWAKEKGIADLFAEGINDTFIEDYKKGWRPADALQK